MRLPIQTNQLQTQNLSKKFGDFTAVNKVSIAFQPGKIHALLGENGAGKSTLMKLLFGLEAPSSGEIFLDGKAIQWSNPQEAIAQGLGMVQQHFQLVETLSALDNIILAAEPTGSFGRLKRKEAKKLLQQMLPSKSLEVPWDAKVSELSVGDRQRIEILKLLYRKAKILFLDEPTAVLAPQEIDEFFVLLRELKNKGHTIVLITHKIQEVFAVCDDFSILRAGQLVLQGQTNCTDEIKIVEAMIGRKPNPLQQNRTLPLNELALEVTALGEPEVGHGRARDLNLQLHRGEIVGIAGVEGSGQTSLVDCIFGMRKFFGTIKIFDNSLRPLSIGCARKAGCSLVPEDRHQQAIWLDESVENNYLIGLTEQFSQFGILRTAQVEQAARKWSEEYDLRASSLDLPIRQLSGGNQQKVVFAREILGHKPKLLICHQPTRGVDLGAIELIHLKLMELRNAGIAILLISSELDELLALSDRIYVLYAGRTAAEFARSQFDRLTIGAAMTGAVSGVGP